MADSLGKKTHLSCVLHLFWNASYIWGRRVVDPTTAWRVLETKRAIDHAFRRNGWPWDKRSKQAYVHRFFRWLALRPEEQADYPTVILAAGDSVALRQCLWLDFVDGTPEAQRAIQGLSETLSYSTNRSFTVGPESHDIFCDWVGIPTTDNTRRGPFARWLEDAGIGFAPENRRGNETTVLVAPTDENEVTPEALIYGLWLEFAKPHDIGELRSVTLAAARIRDSVTCKALMLSRRSIAAVLEKAVRKRYVQRVGTAFAINPERFGAALRRQLPLPAQSWIVETPEESETDVPLNRDVVKQLQDFPDDECFATSGSPFITEEEYQASLKFETVTRRMRETAFAARVAAAYRHRCCFTGMSFRSPSRTVWHGAAAHIVPHSGTDRNGKAVYGRAAVANGMYLSQFAHWCFDKGWLTLDPKRDGRGRLAGYQILVSELAQDEFFAEEKSHLDVYSNRVLDAAFLPGNNQLWPSIDAVQWHRENIFIV